MAMLAVPASTASDRNFLHLFMGSPPAFLGSSNSSFYGLALSSWLPRLVLFGGGRADKRVRPRFDCLGKFAEILADVAHVFQNLIDIFRVRIECAIQLASKLLQLRQVLAQIENRFVNIGPILCNECIHMV